MSAIQQSDCYTYVYILFYVLFHNSLSQGIEYSSMCYTVGPCYCYNKCYYTHFVYNSLHLLIPNSYSIPPPAHLHLDNQRPVLFVCESVSASYISSFVSYFRFYIYVILYGIYLSDLIHLV